MKKKKKEKRMRKESGERSEEKKVCTFWKKGNCKKGRVCPFAHPQKFSSNKKNKKEKEKRSKPFDLTQGKLLLSGFLSFLSIPITNNKKKK